MKKQRLAGCLVLACFGTATLTNGIDRSVTNIPLDSSVLICYSGQTLTIDRLTNRYHRETY